MSLTISPLKQANVSLNPGVWKRSNSSSDDDNHHENGNSYKKTRLSYCYNVILESESSQPSDLDSDNESIYSLQGQETEYARDTSDTSTSPGTWITLSGTNYQSMDYEPDSESESEDGMLITAREYEPVSESDTGNDENPLIFTSSSENEEYIAPNVIFEIFQSDTEYADNSDDSRTSYDSEISHTDYWKCIQCNATQNNPLFRYCEKCYKLRKSYFTPRPKAKGKRDKTDNKNKIKNDNKKDKSDTILSQGSTVDSGVASNASQESQSSSIGPYNNIDNSINNLTESMISSPSSSSLSILSSSVIKNDGVDNVDSVDTVDSVGNNESVDFDAVKNVCKMKRSVSTLSEGSISGQSVITSSQNSNENDKNCMICTVAPRDGAFAHEKKKME